MQKAMFQEDFGKKNIVKCYLCPQYCLVQEGKQGACAVRKNIGGKLYSLVYGKAIANHVDPIEKKPLFHFRPGSRIYSYATAGCNMKCSFCQNYGISQISKGTEGKIVGRDMSPKDIVDEAKSYGCQCIAMTYNEPTIQFEYAYDVCKEAKKKGMDTVFVSNGYITKEAIDKLAPVLDAINIDLKAFNKEYYNKICGSRFKPILEAIKHYHDKGVWMEITTLVIPDTNDSEEELTQIAEFIAGIEKNIPWHISRFHPDYKMMDKKSTPIETLERAYNIGKKAGLKYIYVGNVFGHDTESTFCPGCKKKVIGRQGYMITENILDEGKCVYCKTEIDGVFQ